MTGETDCLYDSRGLLFDFALVVMDWARCQDDAGLREELIHASRSVGPATGVADCFEDFADWLEDQSAMRGETR